MLEQISGISSLDSLQGVSFSGTPNSVNENLFVQLVKGTNDSLVQASKMAEQVSSGKNIDTHSLMIEMANVKMKFSLMIEIRNKLVESYQELSRMPI